MRGKKEKKKIQFSKLHVLFANALVFYVYSVSAILSVLGKTPISDVAIAIITVYGAFATGGYFAVNAIRDTSLNKHGLRVTEYGEKHCVPSEHTDVEG